MPVAVVMDFDKASLDQYDKVIEGMGFRPGGPGAAGCLFHFAAAKGDGIRVVDVWSDRESFERFAEDQIGPHTQAAGIETAPTVTFVDVHNHLTAN